MVHSKHGVQHRRVLWSDFFFVCFEIFSFVVAICDIVHGVDTINCLFYLLKVCGENLKYE